MSFVTLSAPLRSTKPPFAPGILIDLGMIAAAIPPIVDSAHPANEPATSPARVRPPMAGRLARGAALAVPAGREPRTHTGQ